MLKSDGASDLQKKLSDLDLKDFKVLKKARLFFMIAGRHQQTVKKGFALTNNGEYIYYYHPTEGIYRLGTGG